MTRIAKRSTEGCPIPTQAQFSVTGGSLSLSSAPALPTLTAITLNGQAQTTNTTMTNFTVLDATGSAAGWNVTVNGNSAGGKSPAFKQYCPNATCGSDTGPGYVTSGQTLAANSLTLSSTGVSFTGQSGTTETAPTLQCASACNVDSGSAVKSRQPRPAPAWERGRPRAGVARASRSRPRRR